MCQRPLKRIVREWTSVLNTVKYMAWCVAGVGSYWLSRERSLLAVFVWGCGGGASHLEAGFQEGDSSGGWGAPPSVGISFLFLNGEL